VKSSDTLEPLYEVRFETLSIGNIATPLEHNLNNQIWLQSQSAAKLNVWYELGRPAKEYARYWDAFLWLALFLKYVSDALELCVEAKTKVHLKYFQREFAEQIKKLHSGDPSFENWIAAYGKGTFSPTQG
jgi:DNA (cytosine-5)-methyltransferase 1